MPDQALDRPGRRIAERADGVALDLLADFLQQIDFGRHRIADNQLAEAGLSFLGLGIAPPGAAWGSMISDGKAYLMTSPLLSIAPGIAVMLVVFGFNMVGDGLRDALDPRLRGTL